MLPTISKKDGKSTGSTFFASRDTSMDVTDEQMARSPFGQSSNVAKAFRKK